MDIDNHSFKRTVLNMVKNIWMSLFVSTSLMGEALPTEYPDYEKDLLYIERLIGEIKGESNARITTIINEINEDACIGNEGLNQIDPRDRKWIFSITLGGSKIIRGEGFMDSDFVSRAVAYSTVQEGQREGERTRVPLKERIPEDEFYSDAYQKELWVYGQKFKVRNRLEEEH